MNDWAVVWLMLLVVAVLWRAAHLVHTHTERRTTAQWNARYAPRRHP